ncbi:hypothetical protein M8494_11895 [Serratia ureilytica]
MLSTIEDRGDEVVLNLVDGTSTHADIVIGADGINRASANICWAPKRRPTAAGWPTAR